MQNPAPDVQTPYEQLGGASAVRAIVDRFYTLMDSNREFALLRQMHGPDLTPMRDLLFEFLSGWLGGPRLYFERPEHRCVMSAHRRFAIGPEEAEQWLACMDRAMLECGVDGELHRMIGLALTRVATAMRNRDV